MTIGPLPPSVIAAVISALLTGGLSYYVSYRNNVRKQKNRRRSLRESIIAEIEAMEIESIDTVASDSGHNRFPTTIYESNAGKIGSLTEDERKAIVGFYSSIIIKKSELETARSIAIHADSLAPNPLSVAAVNKLNNRREKVLGVIRSELNDDGG